MIKYFAELIADKHLVQQFIFSDTCSYPVNFYLSNLLFFHFV